MRKKFIKFSLFVLAMLVIGRLCHLATDGFSLVNIYSPKGENHLISSPCDGGLSSLISGPFHYLDSGSQSYVFLSADGKTILKFFKFQHMRIPPWMSVLPLPEFFAKKREAKRLKKQEIMHRTLHSYQIAFENMREESGLLFIHLSPTLTLNTKVTIYDKIGKKHKIDLDRVEFILQKKASLAYEKISKWMAHGKTKKAEKGLQDLLRLAMKRCQKGIFDKDPDFSTNFGFVDDTPIQIDVGRFALSEEEKNPSVYKPEMIRITRKFHEWLEKNHPYLLSSFDKEMETLTACH